MSLNIPHVFTLLESDASGNGHRARIYVNNETTFLRYPYADLHSEVDGDDC